MYAVDEGENLTGRFRNAGAAFRIPTEKVEQAAFVPELSLRWQASENLSLGAWFRSFWGEKRQSHTGALEITWEFS
jgi:uncharacterized protein with beta-barrel porin domain